MSADNGPAPSTSRTYPPASVGLPDESPPPNPATAPGERRARAERRGERRADAEPPDESPPPNPERGARTERRGERRAGAEPPDESPPREPTTAPGDRGARLARLGDRIAELSARIQAATYELLVLIREFDERDGWHGCLSCAEWLSWRAGLSLGAAREHVRVARALGELPKLSDAMRRGKVSYSKVRAVTRVATPENEQTLLDVALAGTAAHVERIARAWRRIDRNVEQAEERRREASRELRTWVDEDGMVVVRGRLTPEVGAVLRRALEAACDQARRAPASDGGREEEAAAAPASPEKEAAAAPACGDREAAASTGAPAGVEELTLAQRQADAIGTVAEAALAGGLDRGTAGDRYQVVLHVDAEALAEPRDVPAGTSGCAASESEPRADGGRVPAGTSAAARAPSDRPGGGSSIHTEMPDRGGPARRRWRRTPGACPGARPTPAGCQTVLDEAAGIHVSAETARRMACDAATVSMRHGPGGEILDVGRRTRTISPALRRALAARDRQCRFPGCGNVRCDVHHLEHWADGGRTALDNLVLLCRRHHRAVHEEGFRVTLDADGGVQFVGPDGRPLPEAPPAPAWAGPALQPTNDGLAEAGIEIGADTGTPSWRGEPLDLGYSMSVLWRPRREPPARNEPLTPVSAVATRAARRGSGGAANR